jgi:hypothetical protein
MLSVPFVSPPVEEAPWPTAMSTLPPPPPPPSASPNVIVPLPEESTAHLAPKSPSSLGLADTTTEPELGTAEFPTVGSANHRFAACKPCAFLHKQGCGNGVNCSFCHLCDAGAKKRRQIAKKMKWQSMKQEVQAMASIAVSSVNVSVMC